MLQCIPKYQVFVSMNIMIHHIDWNSAFQARKRYNNCITKEGTLWPASVKPYLLYASHILWSKILRVFQAYLVKESQSAVRAGTFRAKWAYSGSVETHKRKVDTQIEIRLEGSTASFDPCVGCYILARIVDGLLFLEWLFSQGEPAENQWDLSTANSMVREGSKNSRYNPHAWVNWRTLISPCDLCD